VGRNDPNPHAVTEVKIMVQQVKYMKGPRYRKKTMALIIDDP
jgi:hypothetical protein